MPDVTEPYIRPNRYPGLREEESDLLRAYLMETETEGIERLRTSVPVGKFEDPIELEEPYRTMAKRLSQWKIDVVVDYPSQTDVIELKSRATHTALGQVVGYAYYLGQLDQERTNPRLKVVAYREHPSVREFAEALGAVVHTIPKADPTSASRNFEVDSLQPDG